jgi:hypothetical protein
VLLRLLLAAPPQVALILGGGGDSLLGNISVGGEVDARRT